MSRRPLIAGNWKMNGSRAALAELDAIAAAVRPGVDVAICPPFTLITAAAERAPGLIIGAQDCHQAEAGAHTGCVSAAMLVEAGARAVIVGHSERRADQGESDALVRAKAEAALKAGLLTIVCVGETEAERDAGKALAVVERQLRGSIPPPTGGNMLAIAYEPVWAIGTGRTPSLDDIAAMHEHIRVVLTATIEGVADEIRILYGGSVKPGNAREILALPDVDGALVGGASLTAADFGPIIEAAG